VKVIYLIRGLPGSGKSTLALSITDYRYEADDYFETANGYQYDRSKIADAHEHCQEKVKWAMESGIATIAVSNTFCKKWELNPYWTLAHDYGYQVIEVVVKGNFKSIHNIPDEVMERMRLGFEN